MANVYYESDADRSIILGRKVAIWQSMVGYYKDDGTSASGAPVTRFSYDALGNLVRFHLMPGHRFDTVGVPPLLDGIAFGGLIADKAFDTLGLDW